MNPMRLRMIAASSSLERTASRLRFSHQRRFLWVPIAYRGVRPSWPSKPTDRSTVIKNECLDTKSSNSSRRTDKKSMTRTHMKSLRTLHGDLINRGRIYRSTFSTGDHLKSISSDEPNIYKYTSNGMKSLTMIIVEDIRAVCEGIHDSDQWVERSQIEKSEDNYQRMCQVLQRVIETSASMCTAEVSDIVRVELVNMAVASFSALAKLVSERNVLMQTTYSWNLMQEPSFALFKSNHNLLKLRYIQPTKELEAVKTINEKDLAYQDPSKSLRDVWKCIASDVELKHKISKNCLDDEPELLSMIKPIIETPEPDHSMLINRLEIESAVRRMSNLVEELPSTWKIDIKMMNDIFVMCCRACTLSSARLCFGIFIRNQLDKDRRLFSLVLQSYLQASKHDPNKANRLLAGKEAISIASQMWTKEQYLSPQRINQCTIVLCSLFGSRHSPEIDFFSDEILGEVVRTLKLCLGGKEFDKLEEGNLSFKNIIMTDGVKLHFINVIIRFYADSRDSGKVVCAQRLLSQMIRYDVDDIDKHQKHLVLEACNSVLRALTLERESGNKEIMVPNRTVEGDMSALEYSVWLLETMLSRKESSFWPNEESFTLVIRSLCSANPPDKYDYGESIVSLIEICSFRAERHKDYSFTPAMSMYHHILECWMKKDLRPTETNAACRGWKLVKKLEMQSTPFLLMNDELPVATIYKTSLRPNVSTYRLIQKLCLKSSTIKSNLIQTSDVALQVYRRLREQDLIAEDGQDDFSVTCLIKQLPVDNPIRLAGELELNSYEKIICA